MKKFILSYLILEAIIQLRVSPFFQKVRGETVCAYINRGTEHGTVQEEGGLVVDPMTRYPVVKERAESELDYNSYDRAACYLFQTYQEIKMMEQL